MKHDKISFAIKVTNWCNLKCAHCCENSGPRVMPNLMPVAKVEKYIGEFKAMPLSKWNHLVFTGGEAMAPYFLHNNEYMPRCLSIAGNAGMYPFVKTNGTWGADEALRHRILQDCANVAEKNGKMTSLDISVDEFHKNVPAVAQIIVDIASSDYLARRVRVSICGLDTIKSHAQFNYLIAYLKSRNVHVFPCEHDFIAALGTVGTRVLFDFSTPVARMGRAKTKGMGETIPDGATDSVLGNCLQIDNDDIATLNYYHKTPVNGRPVFDVARELLLKVR